MLERNFTLETFKSIQGKMIAKSGTTSNLYGAGYIPPTREYSLKEVEDILSSGSIEAQRKLSRDFFYRNSFYKNFVLYYATILLNAGILIPHPSFGKSLSQTHINKRYFQARDYVDTMKIKDLFTSISLKVLINGCYCGVVQELDKDNFVLLDLPPRYSCSRYRDYYGKDIVEFDVSYFNTFKDETDKKNALKVFPKEISSYYLKWSNGKASSNWVKISTEKGVYFSLTEEASPYFLSVIPSLVQYQISVDTELERQHEEIRKMIVQQIPHLNDGTLLFEPDEALEMHVGAVGMLGNNKNTSVMTTYGEVKDIGTRTSAEAAANNLSSMIKNIYGNAGISKEIFGTESSAALMKSITTDINFMMILGHKYEAFIGSIINRLFGNGNIQFSYTILPVSSYNLKEFMDEATKLSSNGYSLLIPSAAFGINERSLVDLKHLENDVLKINSLLIPPSTSYTQPAAAPSSDEGEAGAPAKDPVDKQENTIEREKQLEQGGSK